MKRYPQFALQFDPSEIGDLAQRYGYEDDTDALNARKRLLAGDYRINNLREIVRWKSAKCPHEEE
jgi:hypothetical protein